MQALVVVVVASGTSTCVALMVVVAVGDSVRTPASTAPAACAVASLGERVRREIVVEREVDCSSRAWEEWRRDRARGQWFR